jgi:hypothetical protein
MRTADTKQTQQDNRRLAEAFIELLMVRQPPPLSHLPPLSQSLLFFPVMLLRQHPFRLQEYLWESTLDQVISSTASQGQVLLHSLATCYTQSVFSNSATFA